MGMSFGQGLGMQINVQTKDDPSAVSMAQTLQGLIAMASMSQGSTPQSTEMLKKVQIAAEGSQVKLALALDKSEIEKLVKEAQTSSVASASKPTTTTKPASAPPEPSGPKTIRITGLESGPVEVPFGETKK